MAMAATGVLAGCKSKPSAGAVCSQLEAAGVASNCKNAEPRGIGAAAAERVTFDISDGRGEDGQVLRFEKDSDFKATVAAFDAAAALAGRHRYGAESALIFVQLNSGTSTELGSKAKAVVEGL